MLWHYSCVCVRVVLCHAVSEILHQTGKSLSLTLSHSCLTLNQQCLLGASFGCTVPLLLFMDQVMPGSAKCSRSRKFLFPLEDVVQLFHLA